MLVSGCAQCNGEPHNSKVCIRAKDSRKVSQATGDELDLGNGTNAMDSLLSAGAISLTNHLVAWDVKDWVHGHVEDAWVEDTASRILCHLGPNAIPLILGTLGYPLGRAHSWGIVCSHKGRYQSQCKDLHLVL